MDNPDDDKTIINVKGVPKSAWEAARREAAKAGDAMGIWLAGAIHLRVDVEAGAVKLPGKAPLTPDQAVAVVRAAAEYQTSLAAMKAAGAPRVQSLLAAAQSALLQIIETPESGKPQGKQSQERPIGRQSAMINGHLSTESVDKTVDSDAAV